MRRLIAIALLLFVAGCGNYVERTREVGHQGKAKVNPFLAAERFLEAYGYTVETGTGWPRLNEGNLNTLFLPASTLTSEGYLNSLDQWVRQGGHAVVFLEWGERYYDDWSGGPGTLWLDDDDPADPLRDWLGRQDIRIESHTTWDSGTDRDRVSLDGERYEVTIESNGSARVGDRDPESVISKRLGGGRVTVVADARLFRNRYIGDADHAALLLSLAEMTDYGFAVQFVRNTSISFWGMLWRKGWPALVPLILLVVFWLWRSLPRFGPLDSVLSEGDLRAYDHHLEALGGFHWRLDRAERLLRPLRQAVLERAQHLALSSGHHDADLFQLMADRSGVPRERVERAMTFERARDAGSFTRLVSDLQSIHLSIP